MKTPEEQEAFAKEMLRLTDSLSGLVRTNNGILRTEDIEAQQRILQALTTLRENYMRVE